MNKELYVSTTPHETKVALVEDDQLAEVYFERENEYTLAGSIYKGRVTRVLPGMQSAFVDIGLERDAFLYVSDFLELQDEDEEGEFGEMKVSGAALAQANGLIVGEARAAEDEEAGEEESAEGEGGPSEQGGTQDAARFRGRRRRRGRRGGRERDAGAAEPRAGAKEEGDEGGESAAGEGEPGSEREPDAREPRRESSQREPSSREPSQRERRRRELRGFEPKGLVSHGLSRSADAEQVAPGGEAEEPAEFEEESGRASSSSSGSTAGGRIVLPGESISKYNRGEGQSSRSAPAEPESAGAEGERGSDAGFGRGAERSERGRRGERESGGRGRRGGRGRERERDREPREREREPRDGERSPLPENYTPIVLPGESISKYRGVTPMAVPELVSSPEPEAEVHAAEVHAADVQAEAPRTSGSKAVENPDEPLASASYSGAGPLPSLTQRYAAESEAAEPEAAEPEAAEPEEAGIEEAEEIEEFEAEESVEAEAASPSQTAASTDVTPAASAEVKPAAGNAGEETEGKTEQAEAAGSEAAGPAAGGADEEAPRQPEPKRRSWRARVPKLFGAAQQEQAEVPPGEVPPAELAPSEAPAEAVSDVVEDAKVVEARKVGEAETESETESETQSETETQEASPYESQLGRFVIEGGNVEHEELDEDEAEMPALAEHFDRYEENEDEAEEEGNGSQFGEAIREAGEENELENDEYDFGEEFEESEILAGPAVEEEEEEGEEEDEPIFARPPQAAPEAGRQRPERFERRERRSPGPQRGGGRMRARQQSRALPLISELLKEGQEILVQIAKEPIGKKGARITSHIALPGRFLVYMPTVNHIGVSRKISSEEERHRLKRIVGSERENGHGGFIVRTAAANIREEELRADIRFLKHLWNEIRTRADSSRSPALIYHDLNLVERILRDQVTSDFSQIWVDNESEYERVVRFASRFQPSLVRRIKLYTKETPLYEQFGISEEINKSLKSKVWLKSGGYIVINQTEALVAIDVNTGKYVGKTSRLEDTIVKTNCDAVREIVRQVRLRDLGGIIIVDFIDMDERKNRQKVMQTLEEAMKADRAPSKILQFNDFGLVAITRKRVKQSLERTLSTPCPYCDATGFVKSVQTVCNEIFVEMRKMRRHVDSKEVILRVNPEVARELKSGNGKWLQEMEELLGHPVLVKSDALLHQEKFDMNY